MPAEVMERRSTQQIPVADSGNVRGRDVKGCHLKATQHIHHFGTLLLSRQDRK